LQFEFDFAVFAFPAAFVFFLVFPLGWETNTWLGLDIVPPHIFRALAVRPDVFASDTARVTADALVEMEYH